MIHRRSARNVRGTFVATALATLLLVSCSGGGGGDDSSTNADWSFSQGNGRLVGGIDGVPFTAQIAITDTSTNSTKTTTTTGVTDAAGKFTFGYSQDTKCTTDKDFKETCVSSGPATYGNTTFSICGGVALPILPGPGSGDVVVRTAPAYTAWDFFSDQTSIDNLASVLLMANTNSGDPAKTGVRISSALRDGTCADFNWSSPNIQQDAASVQSTAKKDGTAHDWPKAAAVRDYLTKTYLCSHSGRYGGTHVNIATAGYPAATISGDFAAFVGFDGEVEGYVDFGDRTDTPYSGVVPFRGTVAIAPGGVGSVSYTAPADAPVPNMRVSLRLLPYGANGSWQSADGSVGGSTAHSDGQTAGMSVYSYAGFPKYRFLKKDVSYTRPGASAPENFVMTMDVNYDGEANGALLPWPPRPRSDPADILTWDGTMNGNAISLHWNAGSKDTTPTTDKPITLTLDPETGSLTGTFPGKDGGWFITFTADPSQRWEGCPM